MKRMTTVLSLLLLSLAAVWAQHPRTPLFEEFTSSTCGPCAVVKPVVAQFAEQSPDVVVVTYHMNWPKEGDPYNVHNPADNNARRYYYNVSGIPAGYMSGSNVNLSSVSALRAAADQVKARPTPIMMTLTENRSSNPYQVTVTVKNDGSAAIRDATLHVMVVNYYADLTNALQGQTQHVYTTFEYAMLKALPNGNGTALTLAPNEQKTFTFTYSRGTSNVWVPNNQYVIAFVQLNATREVLQAISNLNDNLNRVEITASAPRFGIIARQGTTNHELTITNPTSRAQTISLQLNSSSSVIPPGWNITVTPSSLSLQPGETKTATIRFTAANTGSFGFAVINVQPQGNGINQPTTYYCGYLTENTKYAIIYGYMGGGINPFAQAIMSGTKYAQETALMPPIAAVELDLPCEAIILPIDYNGRGALQNQTLIDKVISWVQQKKRLFIYGQLEAYFALATTGANTTTRNFFMNTLGIRNVFLFTVGSQVVPYYHLDVSTGTPTPFTIQGKPNDPISNNISLTLNSGTQYPNSFTDALQMASGTNAIPIFTYDNNSQYIGGVRVETNDTRIVFTTFGLEAIGNTTARNQVAQRIMDWLTAAIAPQPKIELVQTTGQNVIQFDPTPVGSQRAHTFKIRNSGTADLVVNEIAMDPNDVREYGDVFVITDGGTTPITIRPGNEHPVTIEFRPKKVETVQAAVFQIRSNAGNIDLTVIGDGIQSVEPSEVTRGGLSLAIVPNPVFSEASVRTTVNVAQPADLVLLDSRGAEVVRLASGLMGTTTVQLDAATLASGIYRLILRSGTEYVSVPVVVVK